MRCLLFLLALTLPASAIPNTVFGGIVRSDSPLNDRDLTEALLAGPLWAGGEALPGRWRDEAPAGTVRYSHLLARPKAFGQPVLMVQAAHRGDRLDALTLTFADAGSFFGYGMDRDIAKLPRGEQVRLLRERQEQFATEFAETSRALQKALGELTGSRPRDNRLGKTRTLRAEVQDYRHGDLTLRFLKGGERLLRVVICRTDEIPRTWLDPAAADRPARTRVAEFAERLVRSETGDVRLADLPTVPQGYRPYCGLNTLAMAARYFGLHVDEDWLAVAGQFQNTGSAAGSRMPRLYQAVAKEAELDMIRLNGFDLTEARRSLQDGLPVIVWRRYSAERDRAHTTHARRHRTDPDLTLPAPTGEDRETFPREDAPLHASVLVGFNDRNRELLFVESWVGLDYPRRMRIEELEATAYLTFCFRP